MRRRRAIKRFLYLLLGIVILISYSLSPDKTFDDLSSKYVNSSSKFISIDGQKVHYRDEGKGEAIVLIHGTGSSLHTWDAWSAQLKKKYRVIRFDLPAFGLTGADPKKRYLSSDYVNLLDSLMNRLGVRKFHLAGNSLGGLVSWLYASSYPQKVDRLILVDPSGFPFDQTPAVIQLAKIPILNLFLRYVTPKSFIKKNLEEVYYDDTLISASLIDRYHDLSCFQGNRQAFLDRAKIEREDYTHLLKQIVAPTLVLWGENDAWIPVSDANRYAKEIPQAKVVILPKTGHVPMEERPYESLKVLESFMSYQQPDSIPF